MNCIIAVITFSDRLLIVGSFQKGSQSYPNVAVFAPHFEMLESEHPVNADTPIELALMSVLWAIGTQTLPSDLKFEVLASSFTTTDELRSMVSKALMGVKQITSESVLVH